MIKKILVSMLLLVSAISCGPQAFVKGDYDKDVTSTNLLNDQWSETDMQQAVKDLVASLSQHPAVSAAKTPPIVILQGLQNKTSEHIDTQSVGDMLRVELMKSGKMSFVNKEGRSGVTEELEHQETSGQFNEANKKKKGGQISADFYIDGRLYSIVQEVGKDKTVYYKLTLQLTNLNTNLMVWTDQKQIRKVYKKKSIGL
jgi:uncharacterized protein (TIGR02722 family)